MSELRNKQDDGGHHHDCDDQAENGVGRTGSWRLGTHGFLFLMVEVKVRDLFGDFSIVGDLILKSYQP